jgi:small-conductance mechanosensitive channel
MDYSKIFPDIYRIILIPSFYWQILALALCFLLIYLFYKLCKKFVFPRIDGPSLSVDSYSKKVAARYVQPLLLPTLAVIILSIGAGIFTHFYKDAPLFSTIIQLFSLLLFLRFLRVFFESNWIANIVGFLLIPILVLSILGLLDPTIDYLDSLSIKIGSMRISIYMVLKGITILLAVFWSSGLASRKIKNYIESKKSIKSSTKSIIGKIIDLIIYFLVFVIILKVFGVDTTTFAVVGGAVGVGIGFGLQKIASNFISGIILLFEKSVQVGDWIELDDGTIGTMTYFGSRYILIEAFDGKEIMVPNEDFITHRVNNLTYNNTRGRIEIKLTVAYGTDVRRAQELMMQSAKENPRCLRYPTIECHVINFTSSGIEMILYFWVSNVIDGRMAPKSEVMITILQKFKEHGVEIPLPQMDLYVKNRDSFKVIG